MIAYCPTCRCPLTPEQAARREQEIAMSAERLSEGTSRTALSEAEFSAKLSAELSDFGYRATTDD